MEALRKRNSPLKSVNLLGGGNGIQALEVRYNWDGTPLSDEDKAVNAATYAKVVAGGEYIFYETSFFGGKWFAVAQIMPTEDYPMLGLVFDSAFLSTLDYPSEILSIAISESGEVQSTSVPFPTPIINFSNPVTSFNDFYEGFVAKGIMVDYLFIVGVFTFYLEFNLENGRYFGGKATVSGVDGSLFVIRFDDGTTIYAEDNMPLQISVDKPIVSLDNPDDIDYDNKYLFGRNTGFRTFNATIYYGGERYTPISWKTTSIVTDGKVNLAVQFVIYRNGVYETWQVMDDGTTQQITS